MSPTTKNILIGAAVIVIIYLLLRNKKPIVNSSNNTVNSGDNTETIVTSGVSEFINNMSPEIGSQNFSNLKLVTVNSNEETTVFVLDSLSNNTGFQFYLPDGVYDKIKVSYYKGNPLNMQLINNGVTYNGANTGGTMTFSAVTINGTTKITAS